MAEVDFACHFVVSILLWFVLLVIIECLAVRFVPPLYSLEPSLKV